MQLGIGFLILMSDEDSPVARRADDEASATAKLMFEELETVCSAVTYVDQLRMTWQRRRSLQPQQTFSRVALSPLSIGFRFGNFAATMQYLIAQTDDFSRLGIDGQAVVGDKTSSFPLPIWPRLSRDLWVVKSNSVES